MKRIRVCDAVCRALFDIPDLDAVTFDVVDNHPTLRFKIRKYSSPRRSRDGAEVMSILSRTPGLLVKSELTVHNLAGRIIVSGAIVVRPPWPIMGRDAIRPPESIVVREAEFRLLNNHRGVLIRRSLAAPLPAWEARQLDWLDAAVEADVDKTCPREYPNMEEASR